MVEAEAQVVEQEPVRAEARHPALEPEPLEARALELELVRVLVLVLAVAQGEALQRWARRTKPPRASRRGSS